MSTIQELGGLLNRESTAAAPLVTVDANGAGAKAGGR